MQREIPRNACRRWWKVAPKFANPLPTPNVTVWMIGIVYANTVSILHWRRRNACRRDTLRTTNLRRPHYLLPLSLWILFFSLRTLAFPFSLLHFLSLSKILFSISINSAARVTFHQHCKKLVKFFCWNIIFVWQMFH